MSDRVGWPAGYGRLALDRVDSTNAEALRLASSGLSRPVWITAKAQEAGRGRRARPWASPPGNLYATLAMTLDAAPASLALRSFVAAVALHQALDSLTGAASALRLKWPNDVLLNGGKVAGILLESSAAGPGRHHLAIGFGVNLIAHPPAASVDPGTVSPGSILLETGLRIEPERALAALAVAFEHWENLLSAQGFAPVREAWLARAARLGEPITARTMRETFAGVFDTVDEAGNLVLNTAAGPVRLPAADVYF